MRILCTFPGRNGDILWSLPTARAISQALGETVDFQVAGEFRSLQPVLVMAPYIGRAFADLSWILQPPEEWHAPSLVGIDVPDTRQVDARYDRVVHLGYRKWPDQSLPRFVYAQTQREYPDLPLAPLDLDEPWLNPAAPREVSYRSTLPEVTLCMTEEWIELKMGVLLAVAAALKGQVRFTVITPTPIGRHQEWASYWPLGVIRSLGWLEAVRQIARSTVVVSCNSALWVVANALGKPLVMLEPSEARQNPIFWLDHPRNHWVLGGDGKPTHDARATLALLRKVLDA